MKIKSTLIGISIISALLLIVNIISFVLLVRNTEEQVQAFQTESTVWQLKEELITVSDYLTERARAYVSTGDESFYNEYMQEVNEDKTYASVIERFEQILPENLLAIIRNVQEESAQLAQVETESFEAMRSGNTQQAVNMLYDSRYFDGKTRINSYLEEFNVEIAKWIDQLSASAQKNVTAAIIILASAVILSSIFSVIASAYVIKKMRPLFTVIDYTERVAKGDLTLEPLAIKSGAKDEIAQLSIAFNEMFLSLKQMIGTVHDASVELSASAEQLNANVSQSTSATERVTESMESIASGAQTEFEHIEESSKAVAEVAQGVQHIASAASDVASSSSEVSKRAEQGGQGLKLVINQMQEVDEAVGQTMQTIDTLSTQSKEIENIVETITTIADQTNLLALNAAIEAARAGESGKGFAVVADEVRKLAEQSSESAKQIASIIRMIQTDMQTTVRQMTNVNEKVTIGTQSITETGTSFVTIIQAVREVTDQIQEVSAVSEQMAASAEQISATFESLQTIIQSSSQATKDVAALSEEQLASMQEISSATQMLTKLAEDLNESMSKFTV